MPATARDRAAADHALAAALDRLPAIGLDELADQAALLTRRDRKYLVPVADAADTVAQLVGARVLSIDGRRAFRYESVYFDTPDLVSYLAAARRRPRRFKVRTRTYLDSGLCLLEVKTRDPRGRTVKDRLPYGAGRRTELDRAGLAFVEASEEVGGGLGPALVPALTTSYTRTTLLLPDGARLTIDTGLRAWATDGRTVRLPGIAVIETKGRGAASVADRALWAAGHRPVRISKFCTSLAALHPELPANRWTRALQRPWTVEAPLTAFAAAS
jgi:hypothetical protein